MGKKDDYQFNYLDDNVRFADQINGALFKGKQVVKPDELESEDSQNVSIINMDKTGRKKTRSIRAVVDKARIWRGRKLHILVVENQNYVDYQMVLRNMLSESIGYRKQWKKKKRIHITAKNYKNKDEFLSGINKEEKFAPIITLVVYFGTDHQWDGARCLHDMLDIDDDLKEYVTNYRLNLYDCQEHDTFNEYQTGLKLVFETVRYSKDKEKLKEIMEEKHEEYSSIDSDTKDMLEVVANVKIPEKFMTVEDGKERYDMCKAFEDMRQEGKDEERKEGIRILIQTCNELGLSNEIIIQKCTEKYEITEENARKYVQEYCV